MSSAALNPIANAESWHTVTIANEISPGACELSGFKRTYGWDIKKGKGTLGATLTFNESPPVEGTIKFMLWEDFHFVQWDDFRKHFKYDPTKKGASAVDIYHPSLADIDCKSVVCKSIGAIEHEGKGLYSISVELIEYHPPPKKSAVSTPDGSKSNTTAKTSGVTPDPIADAQQAEIKRLLAEAKKP